ncbi:MAG TPA: dienelactone hydrolase family protein [Xanthobacteraceae bacterium]|jgi:dienelactone hydrolase|nr:dienelactone hydrolase family protein [Xanthobacteraceae bacterium]
MMRLASVLISLAIVIASETAGANESVEFTDAGTTFHGVLFKPQGPGPFPSVVALHGCGGLVNRSGKIVQRFQDWGDRLSSAGLAVLFPDSFTTRGLSPQCRISERSVRSARERVADAQAARRWLLGQDWIAKNRVSLMGWANGGSASLWAARPQAVPRDGASDFRSVIAFYPGCIRLSQAAWSARIPTMILIGRADDWTPAAACEQMVAGARGRSARASIVVYPGAYHEFDRPDYPVRVLTGLARSADGSGRAHVGTNPAARDDAIRKVSQFLVR